MQSDISEIRQRIHLFDEMSEQDNYSTIVINESSIKVREIQKTLNVFNINQDESVDNDVYFRKIHLNLFDDDYQF